MGIKNDPGAYDCESMAAPNEPKFTLLGRDPFGASLVRLWALARGAYLRKHTAPEKIAEANACADAMEHWCEAARGRVSESVLEHLPINMLVGEVARRGYGVRLEAPQGVDLRNVLSAGGDAPMSTLEGKPVDLRAAWPVVAAADSEGGEA